MIHAIGDLSSRVQLRMAYRSISRSPVERLPEPVACAGPAEVNGRLERDRIETVGLSVSKPRTAVELAKLDFDTAFGLLNQRFASPGWTAFMISG